MALVKETGSGLSNSNAYDDVAGVTAYLSDRGYTLTGTTPLQEAAIIKASDFLDSTYTWLGSRVSATQSMAWPRAGASDIAEGFSIASNIVPNAVKRAVAELAYKVTSGVILLQDLDRGGRLASVTVGPISVSYEPNSPTGIVYGITGLLKGLLRPADGAYAISPSLVNSGQPERYFTTGMFYNNEAS